MLKTFKFKQIIFWVLTREKEALKKASTGMGIRHQLLKKGLDSTALRTSIGTKIMLVMGQCDYHPHVVTAGKSLSRERMIFLSS